MLAVGAIGATTRSQYGAAMPICWPPIPPLTPEAAALKVRLAEDAWNTCDPEHVSLTCSLDSAWRDRTDLLRGRAAIARFLRRKWTRELDYCVAMELWTSGADRMAVRVASEWRDDSGNWYRSFGTEVWEVDCEGLVRQRRAATNDIPIRSVERRLRWVGPGPRPADHIDLGP